MKIKKHLKNLSPAQVFIEFVSVVFAVLLALGMNSYKQSIDRKNDAQTIKKSILAECRSNLADLDTILIKNKAYSEYLDSLVRLPKADQKDKFIFNYEFELMTRGAWNIVQNHPAVGELETDFLLDVSDLYHGQDFFMDFSTNMIKEIGPMLIEYQRLEDSDMILSMNYKVSVINTFGYNLKEKYQDLLTKYE
ncbi:MAG: hypothetical protein ABJ004_17080 [Cyclobacteriaceae bacterium]